MNIKRFISLISLFVTVLLSAQTPKGLKSFNAYCLNEPVQGDTLVVEYVMEAMNYRIDRAPAAEGGELLEVSSRVEHPGRRYHKIIYTCSYLVHSATYMKLEPFNMYVNGNLVASKELVLKVSPHSDYGRDWVVARNYLNSLCGYTGLDLRLKYASETVLCFSDDNANVFAVVADKDYHQYIAEPLLAYGIGSRIWTLDDVNDPVRQTFNRYDAQLKHLKAQTHIWRSLPKAEYGRSSEGVKPLLGDIEYGQKGTYNMLFPKMQYEGKDSLCLAGCSAVALAQVLAMYRSSVAPSGKAEFSLKSGQKQSVYLDDYSINWSDMQKRDTAALVFACAASIGAEMSPYRTSGSMRNIEAALIDNWGYSPQVEYVTQSSDPEKLAGIYKELDSGRPVIVSDDSHSFVIDGYQEDFLHFNFGWNGHCNGWYKAVIIPSYSGSQLPFNSMITGIRPLDPSELQTCEITLSKAGTLTEVLSEIQQRHITSLKIAGPVNGDDLALLRQMAGGEPLWDQGSWSGSLMELDLSEARIVSGGRYYSMSADFQSISGHYFKDGKKIRYRYEFPDVSEEEWRVITENGLNDRGGYVYERADDGTYWMTYIASNDVVGMFMFFQSRNLRHIALPRAASIVDDFAFAGCIALRTVEFNGTAGKIYSTAFQDCRRLETPVPVFEF